VSDVVLDSSAVLALLNAEPGAEAVLSVLPGAWLSAVNAAEVIGKLVDRGLPTVDAVAALEATGVEVIAFDTDLAIACGDLRPTTRAQGLSLGDRACLALAAARAVPALTADKAWASVAGVAGVEVRLIR
jgi:PIN domain nuclease of toxin-antitoxin system